MSPLPTLATLSMAATTSGGVGTKITSGDRRGDCVAVWAAAAAGSASVTATRMAGNCVRIIRFSLKRKPLERRFQRRGRLSYRRSAAYESPTCDNFWHTIRKSGYSTGSRVFPSCRRCLSLASGYDAMLVIRPKVSYFL